MNTSRMSDQNHWRNVGKRCANQGWAVDVALTKSEGINDLIREGYSEQTRRIARRETATA